MWEQTGFYICPVLVVRVYLFCLQITQNMILGRTMIDFSSKFPCTAFA